MSKPETRRTTTGHTNTHVRCGAPHRYVNGKWQTERQYIKMKSERGALVMIPSRRSMYTLSGAPCAVRGIGTFDDDGRVIFVIRSHNRILNDFRNSEKLKLFDRQNVSKIDNWSRRQGTIKAISHLFNRSNWHFRRNAKTYFHVRWTVFGRIPSRKIQDRHLHFGLHDNSNNKKKKPFDSEWLQWPVFHYIGTARMAFPWCRGVIDKRCYDSYTSNKSHMCSNYSALSWSECYGPQVGSTTHSTQHSQQRRPRQQEISKAIIHKRPNGRSN